MEAGNAKKRRRRFLIALSLVAAMLLSACGAGGTENGGEAPEETEAEKSQGINAPGFERTMTNAGREASGEKYVHGEEGYFLLAENGAKTELKAQKGLRTSWVYAASTSMETNACLTRGEEIIIDPFAILDIVYGEDNTEGFIAETNNNESLGGHGRSIAETLSNGFGDSLLTAAIDCEGLTREEIQQAIRTHGAMTTGITEAHNGRGFYDGYFTQYDEENKNDHTIAIVGWDDHFPAESFTKTSFVNLPSQDGAWIAQDSLMNTDYIYISYDSKLVDTFIFELSEDYGEVASYDVGNEGTIRTGETTTLANVFHQKGTLAAVGTYLSDCDGITIRILDEKTGQVLHEQSETPEFRGYATFPLDKEIPVDDYRIEITYDGDAPVEGASRRLDDDLRYRASSESGQSFVKIGEKWVDLAKKSTKKKLGIDFAPHNACIKGIYRRG